MAGRRTQKDIEADFIRIRELAKTAKCMEEIERSMELSTAQIKTTLSKHPRIAKKIFQQLEANASKSEPEKSEINTVKSVPEQLNSEVTKTVEVEKSTEVQVTPPSAVPNVKKYVVDASVVGTIDWPSTLNNILANNQVIILTSITIHELHKLEKDPNYDTRFQARQLLRLSNEKTENFESVLIDHTLGSPDFCIIQYCNRLKGSIILLTGDKEMASLARCYFNDVQYFSKVVNPSVTHEYFKMLRDSPFNAAKDAKDQLVIPKFEYPNKMIRVYSRCQPFDNGPYYLRVGDTVLVATIDEANVITLNVYNVISRSDSDNIRNVYSKKFFPGKRVHLPDERYRGFIYNVKKKYNI